jgi:uncharacterized protein with ParB-like and HNH nuclease domain
MTTSRLPKPIDLGRIYDFSLGTLWGHYEEHLEKLKNNDSFVKTTTAKRYACGYPLPYFQRPSCWTLEQKNRFIESVYLGLFIGTFCSHEADWEGEDACPTKFSGWLIDGQQRLLTIEEYWNDEFKVFGYFFSELTRAEKHRFSQTPLKQYKVIINDEDKIKDLYNRLALGGTSHTTEQMAV